MTGGKYYRADDTKRFREIYDEIDRLEKTEVKVKKFVRHTELAQWFILAGLAILLLEVVLANTLWRKIP
jgi:Ca-activated chloride channel family protein